MKMMEMMVMDEVESDKLEEEMTRRRKGTMGRMVNVNVLQ